MSAGHIPSTVDALSPKAQNYYQRVKDFIQKNVAPLEREWAEFHQPGNKDRWTDYPRLTQLRASAKSEGLWNMFIPLESDPDKKYGCGLTNAEYAHICELLGQYFGAPMVFNCQPPDSGNVEVLVKYGTEEQKARWLKPLLDGEIRSCFGMTEPNVASSDATNIRSSIVRDGDQYVINGTKWWTSNALHPECKLCIFMGKTDPKADRHVQQSMILVPMDTPGVKIKRSLYLFGYDDAPEGHAEIEFKDVRVPVNNILLGEGRGFEIAQGRLGPGRIHHCMRLIGQAERALQLMIKRSLERETFGKKLAEHGTIQADIAKSRIEIEQTRLLVLKAAHMMDTVGNKKAVSEIAMIKVAAPNMALRVLDRSIQAHGAAGVSQDYPLAFLWTWARALRLADGPDEVHRRAIARIEIDRYMKSML